MFQGRLGARENTMSPAFVENHCIQYDGNTSTQLQLYGNGLVQGICPTSNGGINCPPSNLKRLRKEGNDAYAYQQELCPMSLTNNLQRIEPGRGGSPLHLSHPISACLKRSCKEDGRRRSSVSASSTDEFSQFLNVQAESMAKGVRELHQKHTLSLLNAFENWAKRKLGERDLVIEYTKRKNKELEEEINRVALEAQSWQCKAKDNESVANALRYDIQQLMLARANEGSGDTSEVDGAVSSCMYGGGGGANVREVEKRYVRCCVACEGKEASAMLLPCRHLCLCAECEGCVDVCPICNVLKAEAVHVYM